MDHTCIQLQHQILKGWPENSKGVPQEIKQYYAFRDELAIQDGLIMKGQRIIIPTALQQEYLQELHLGHPGLEATKARAKETVYWDGMNGKIEETVASCKACNALKPKQQKEPLEPHDVPCLPFEIVATDIFEWRNESYLVTVDSYSGLYEIDRLRDMTSKTIVQKLKKLFAMHGIPRVLVSDNGRQFVSAEFKEFEERWQFTHVTSSPLYPQSNGLAERAVRSAKMLLEKCLRENNDPYLALLHVRNTPRPNLGSTSQRLFSRRTRTTLPMTATSLKPEIVENVSKNLEYIREQKRVWYDKTAKALPKLYPNDVVRMETKKGFDKPAQVVAYSNKPRSYIVESDGRKYERNRRHLLKVAESLPIVVDTEVMVPSTCTEKQVVLPPDRTPTKTAKLPTKTAKPPQVLPQEVVVPNSKVVTTRSGRESKPNPKYSEGYVK